MNYVILTGLSWIKMDFKHGVDTDGYNDMIVQLQCCIKHQTYSDIMPWMSQCHLIQPLLEEHLEKTFKLFSAILSLIARGKHVICMSILHFQKSMLTFNTYCVLYSSKKKCKNYINEAKFSICLEKEHFLTYFIYFYAFFRTSIRKILKISF